MSVENQKFEPVVDVNVSEQEHWLQIDEARFQAYLENARQKEEGQYGHENALKIDTYLGSIETNVREYVDFVNKQLEQLMQLDFGGGENIVDSNARESTILNKIADNFNHSLETFLTNKEKTQKELVDEIGTISAQIAEIILPYLNNTETIV